MAVTELARAIRESVFAFPQTASDVVALASDRPFFGYHQVMRDTFKYITKLGDRGRKPNVEQGLAGRFARTLVIPRILSVLNDHQSLLHIDQLPLGLADFFLAQSRCHGIPNDPIGMNCRGFVSKYSISSSSLWAVGHAHCSFRPD